MEDPPDPTPSIAAPGEWTVPPAALIGVLCAIYVVSMFLRSIAVFAPDLSRDLGLTPATLGLLGSVYFLAFALAQIPVGIAIDRFGARWTIIGSAVIACFGCVMFSLATQTTTLIASRALVGLGCAALFVGPVALYSQWFAADRLSTLTGIQLGVGTLGSLIATAPLAFLVGHVGWRLSFVAVAVIGAAITALVGLIVRDRPNHHRGNSETLAQVLAGVSEVARTPSALRLAFLQFAAYPSFATILTLWGGPWLADVYGMDLAQRGQTLFILAGAQAAGLFLWGPSDRLFGSYKRPIIAGVVCSLLLLALAAIVELPRAALSAWMVAFGLATAFLPVMVAHGRTLFPNRLVGRGITLINVGTMAGVFVLQSLAGAIIGRFEPITLAGHSAYPAEAYRAMFALLAVVLALALGVYAGALDPRERLAASAKIGQDKARALTPSSNPES
jgi:nitrate/nitrite transporter NarK